uniref:Uncharacterized protein n=1 Tax=Chromera velia CCMP2878 TaxID=1169474 RepID=A0A0G4I7V6_9ALVE|eukprot:Cvel_11689.t1-p1 / transcript=Cvel_11689.t1 / gene=Cvel_11689 / organism=Chromera_velia_CCMP2878 / gene_product=hypothetical protein / transcript_product=hypothetical protein / location=Cvel_scaffold741:23863-24618(+) / protein_length=252 / sequence_SO=supercontig / SO=protein_coding / is_pseudo=false
MMIRRATVEGVAAEKEATGEWAGLSGFVCEVGMAGKGKERKAGEKKQRRIKGGKKEKKKTTREKTLKGGRRELREEGGKKERKNKRKREGKGEWGKVKRGERRQVGRNERKCKAAKEGRNKERKAGREEGRTGEKEAMAQTITNFLNESMKKEGLTKDPCLRVWMSTDGGAAYVDMKTPEDATALLSFNGNALDDDNTNAKINIVRPPPLVSLESLDKVPDVDPELQDTKRKLQKTLDTFDKTDTRRIFLRL